MYLAWVMFVHNCFASLQDVATDALAVDLLGDTERGRVVGLMWAAKLIGVSAGGAGIALIVARSGIPSAIAVQALVIFAVCVLVVMFRERSGEKVFPWSTGAARGSGDQLQFGLGATL